MLLRLAVLLAVAACAVLGSPTAASALDMSLNTAAPTDVRAGVHADFKVDMSVGNALTGAALTSLKLHLPPGLLGNPSATPAKCTQAEFNSPTGCPASTKVGETTVSIPLGVPITGSIYNLEPQPEGNATEPARLGIVVAGLIKTQATLRVRVGDYGLTSELSLPATPITRLQMTLYGSLGDKSFMVNPTSCVPAVTRVQAATATDTGTAEAGFTPTECDKVPFTPSLVVGPEVVPADHPGKASATLVVPGGDTDGRVQAHVKRVELLLPEGLVLSPGLANGLTACTPEQFGLTEDREPECPLNSEIGTVEFRTPFFAEPLAGKVYFGTPTPTAKLRNFVSVEDPRLRVKLVGDVTVDPRTGQVKNVFPDSPQVPFTEFRFEYKDGPRAVLSAPSKCGVYTAVATMTPWAEGVAAAKPSDTFETNDCANATKFTPSLSIASSSRAAGADTAVTVTITRPDRQARLLRSTVSLPPGLAGRLGAVPACPVASARKAQCSEASRVGLAQVVVGNGDEPLALPARVYLTEGFDGGIAGLAIVVPAKVGPIDLGTVVTLAKLKLRPGDVGIDVETEDLPQMVEGIPTPYRSIALTIDRKGFMLNPTSCAAQPARGAFTGAGGARAAATATYQATGCGTQPYAPKFASTLGAPGATKRGAHIPFDTVITQQPGEANTAKAEVTLPRHVAIDARALSRACPEDTLLKGGCPATAKVGTVTASSALLPVPLTGDIVLIQPKGGPLPELSLELPLGIRLRATVGFTPAGALATTFPAVPDVPLNRLRVSFDGGPDSVLVAGQDLCRGAAPVVATTFTSHGGVSRTSTSTSAVPCGPGLAATAKLGGVKRRAPALTLKVTATRTKLREVRVAVPKPLRAAALKALRRAARVTADGKRVKGSSLRTSKGRIVIRLPKGGATRVQVVLRRGALRQAGRLRIGRRLPFKVEGRPVDGKLLRVTARTRAKK